MANEIDDSHDRNRNRDHVLHANPVITQFARRSLARATLGLLLGAIVACSSIPKRDVSLPMTAIGSSPAGPAPATAETPLASEPSENGEAKDVVFNLPIAAEPSGRLILHGAGLTDLRNNSTADTLPAVHMLMTLNNQNSDLDWALDARLQRLVFDGDKPLRPTFARAKDQTPPFIRVAKGQTQTIDLYFILPAERQSPADLQSFTLDWTLTAGDRVIEQSTRFASIARDSGPAAVYTSAPSPGATESPTNSASPPSSAGSSVGSSSSLSSSSSSNSSSPFSSPSSSISDLSSQSHSAPVGIQREWWADPFADLPEPWRERVQ